LGDSKTSIQVTISIDGVTTHKKVKVDSFVIGRHQDSDVNILHPQVSRQHLKITVKENKIFLEDLSSSNGTYLNADEERLEAKRAFPLTPNDVIKLGDSGPTVQIQFEEKKAHTTLPKLSKLESLIAPVLPNKVELTKEKPSMPSSISRTPESPKASGLAKAIATDPLSQPLAAQLAPPSLQKESGKSLLETSKQAAQILQKAELQAEAKAQEAYRHAIETEQKAEKHFQDRLKAANNEAQKIFEEARVESLKLLQETRAQTQTMRDQAEQDARELRKSNEEKCTEILREAEAQGHEIKAKRLSEADEIIEKSGQDLLKATYEKIEKEKAAALTQLDSLNAQISKAHETIKETEKEKLETDKKLAEIKKEIKVQQEDYKAKKVNYEKVKSDERSMLSHIELMKKELSEQEENISKNKADSEKLVLDINAMKQKKEDEEKEMSAQLQALKAKIEEEGARITQKETDRTNQLKLQTAEAIKKFEKEMLEEIVRRKTQIAKEILLQVESICPAVAMNDDWKSKRTELDQVFQDVIGSSGEASASKIVDNKAKGKMPTRTKERTTSLMLGLALGIFAAIGGQKAIKHIDGNSPIERMVANAIDNTKAELEKRKFNPPQVNELKDNYVDAVIYTKNFTETYLDAKYQEAWSKAATLYLLKTWRLDENRSMRTLAASAALVKDLAKKKESIHPDFTNSGLEKMKATEKETMARLKEELGGEVRLESFKKFEKRFFENYDRIPAAAEAF
jgi:pSer/pThr/pTyr-binding forkhead associated (FHA) protein